MQYSDRKTYVEQNLAGLVYRKSDLEHIKRVKKTISIPKLTAKPLPNAEIMPNIKPIINSSLWLYSKMHMEPEVCPGV